MRGQLPFGTVTFMLSDLEGSARMWEDLPESMSEAVARHEALVANAVSDGAGVLLKSRGEGDSCFAVFSRASDAAASAVVLQLAMASESWPAGAELRVRVALHTGEAELRGGDYYGAAVNRCARIREVAWGGQTLLSLACAEIVRDSLPGGAAILDLSEHRLRDLTRPERLFELRHRELTDTFPPVRSLASFTHNIPEQLTSLVGRESELCTVRELIRDARLVTLTGAGGCGKTRIAMHLAAEVLEGFPDGVWFVDLASVLSGEDVAGALGTVLGVRERADRDRLDLLSDRIRPCRMMLLFDNCEHVVDSCAALVQRLLAGCPGLRVLATSREPLGVPGETTYRVPSLSVPPDGPDEQFGDLTAWDSTRLFLDRVAAAEPGLTLAGEDAAAVAEICRRLDGMPLGIELAAARASVFSVREIAARLDDRFRLLSSGTRTGLAKQQTLQAAVDWSYDLLTAAERLVLCRCAVFVGGFTLEAAEAVCAALPVERAPVLDIVGRLVLKSLVMREPGGPTTRFRLLETIREYALDKLGETGELVDTQRRHLDWCVGLAERLEPLTYGPGQREALRGLDAEHENLRAALHHAVTDAQRREHGLRLACGLGMFWWIRGHWSEGRRWLSSLACDEECGAGTRIRARFCLGYLAFAQDMYADSESFFDEGLALAREAGDRIGFARCLAGKGAALFWKDRGAATRILEEALEVAREADDAWLVGWTLQLVAGAAGEFGDGEAQRALMDESLSLRREIGDEWGVSWSLEAIARLALYAQDTAGARSMLQASLAIRRELGDAPGALSVLAELAQIAEREGDVQTARELLDESLALRRRVDWGTGAATLQFRLGYASLERGDVAESARHFEFALQHRRRLGDPRGMALSLNDLATVARVNGDAPRARELATEALAIAHGIDHPGTRATCLESFAGLAMLEGDPSLAARVFGAAAAMREACGVPDPIYSRAIVERERRATRDALGDEAFGTSWEQGARLSYEDAAALATSG